MVSLANTISEDQIGLASLFTVESRSCLTITQAATDTMHEVITEKKKRQIRHYNINTRAAKSN